MPSAWSIKNIIAIARYFFISCSILSSLLKRILYKITFLVFFMHDRSALLFITLFFFSLVAFLSPFHEYPIHDDWHYADAVRYLTETGELRVDPVVSPNLLLMVWYGFVSVALLSSFIGFFGALHLTTLLLAFF